jgi:hypothetical protein
VGLKDSNFDKFLAVLEHQAGNIVNASLFDKISDAMRVTRERWWGGGKPCVSVYQLTKALTDHQKHDEQYDWNLAPKAQTICGGE